MAELSAEREREREREKGSLKRKAHVREFRVTVNPKLHNRLFCRYKRYAEECPFESDSLILHARRAQNYRTVRTHETT